MVRRRSFSGKFVIRVGSALHARLAAEASDLGLSLNEHCVRRLEGEQPESRFARLGLDRRFVESVMSAFPTKPLAIALFGSFARDEQTERSDIDLLVVFDSDVPIERALYRFFDDRIDISGFAHLPNPHLVSLPKDVSACGGIWLEVAQEGIVLYEDGVRVSSFLREIRGAIAAGRFVRRVAHGHPYWAREGGGA